MVKIVGKDESKVRRCSCPNCASVLEFVNNEVQSFVDHDYGGGSDTVHYIICSACSKQIKVKLYG